MQPPSHAIKAALDAAVKSPCVKSKRGVSIYHVPSGDLMGTGFNSQPSGRCDMSCMANCNKLCVHAEKRAIKNTQTRGASLRLHEAVHVKILTVGGMVELPQGVSVFNLLVTSGGPSCWQCSREVLDCGLDAIWLYHEEGWRRYAAEEFHRLTLKACGL